MNKLMRAQRSTSVGVAGVAILILGCAMCASVAQAQTTGVRSSQSRVRPAAQTRTGAILNGVYRLDPLASDKLYTVVSEADTNLPYAKQSRFFDDLIVRLSSPDQLAIERRGTTIRIASSRAPRLTLTTDDATQTEDAETRESRTHVVARGDGFSFSSASDGDDFEVTFEPFEGGTRLRVTRKITTAGLNQPVVVRSIYNRVSEIARWDIYAGASSADVARRARRAGVREAETVAAEDADATNTSAVERRAIPAREVAPARTPNVTAARPVAGANAEVELLRASLNEWLVATNSVDINRQLQFYSPRVAAFYLARDVNLAKVRAEKERAFGNAAHVRISASEPEIIFTDAGGTAVMRFRKNYEVDTARARRRGEVVQELRWRRTPQGWRIFSERDVRVIR